MGKLDVSRLMAAPGTERWRGVRSLLPVFEGVVSFGCDELGTVLTSAVVSEMGSAPRFFTFFGRETVPVFFLQDSLAICSAAADVWEGREGQRMKSVLRSHHGEHYQLSAQSRVKWKDGRSDRRERMALSSRSIYLSETLSDMLSGYRISIGS